MTAPTIIAPRIINQSQLASYLGKSKSWLSANMDDLRNRGFPCKLPHVGGYDLREVDKWIDSLASAHHPKSALKGDWDNAPAFE